MPSVATDVTRTMLATDLPARAAPRLEAVVDGVAQHVSERPDLRLVGRRVAGYC